MSFYGYVTSSGNKDLSRASSNNWSVERGTLDGNGYYEITLDQYLHYAPSMVITPVNIVDSIPTTARAQVTAVAECLITGGTCRFYVTLREHRASSGEYPKRADKGFFFSVRSGMTKVFDVSTDNTVTLVPEVVTFNNKKVLMLSTSHAKLKIGTNSLYLDKGTVLIGVGTVMKLKLSTTTVTDNNHTWNLTGWTYGGGHGATGGQWVAEPQAGDASNPQSANYLSVSPGGDNGPATTPYTLAIKGVYSGTPPTGVPQYISSDPIVRLSAVAPGGMTLS